MAKQTINPSQKTIAVARINGVAVNAYQVEAGLQSVLEPHKDTKGKVRLSQPEQYAARKQVIDNLIMRELLFQEACARRIRASKKEIDNAMEQCSGEYETEQQFKAMLSMSGSTTEELREQLKKDILVNKMAAMVVEGKQKTVTTVDAKKHYEEHIGKMCGPEVRRILHIMAPVDRYAPEKESQKIKKRLAKICPDRGAFEKAVKKGSDPAKGIQAEDLGFIQRDQFHPLLSSIAFRLPEGEVSRIIRSEEGLHVLLVTTVLQEGKTWPFNLIKEEIKKNVYELNSRVLLNGFAEELRKKADIEVLDRIADSKLDQEKQ
jgi:parvulin-like peptidyl-prolyl isomerase